MKDKINISVAIAVYNKENQILSTLESVLNQTYPISEIIIVNDGSTDNSEAVIHSIKDSRIKFVSQENKGAAAARNQAISHCTNDFIALLDADDLWHTNFLSEIVKAIKRYPNEKVFSTGIKIEASHNNSFPAKYSILKNTEANVYNYFEGSYLNSLIYSSNVVMHREVFEKIGYFDTRIKSGQDTDLWIRIGIHYPVVFIPIYAVTYRFISNSLSHSGVPIRYKIQFKKYHEAEKTNPALKKFLDLNRYSLAVYAREMGDKESYIQLKSAIDYHNLNKKQKFILSTPANITKLLKSIKVFMERLGWKTTSF